MRYPLKDVPASVVPRSKLFASSRFELQTCTVRGRGVFSKRDRHGQWWGHGPFDHLELKKNQETLPYVFKGSVSAENLDKLQEALSGLEYECVAVFPRYATTTAFGIDQSKFRPQLTSCYVHIWVQIPLVDTQMLLFDKLEATHKARAAAKRRKEAATRAEEKRIKAERAATGAVLGTKVGKATVNELAQALAVLEKAGLKVVTVEKTEKKVTK